MTLLWACSTTLKATEPMKKRLRPLASESATAISENLGAGHLDMLAEQGLLGEIDMFLRSFAGVLVERDRQDVGLAAQAIDDVADLVNRHQRLVGTVGADQMAASAFELARHQHRARRMDRDLLRDRGIEEALRNAGPATRRADDDEVVRPQLVLIEDAGRHVGRRLELQDDRLAVLVGVLDLVVAQRVAGDVGMDDALLPAVAEIVIVPELVEPLLEVFHARELEPPIEHVLADQANLEAFGPHGLVEWAHVEQNDVGIRCLAEPRGIAQSAIRFV